MGARGAKQKATPRIIDRAEHRAEAIELRKAGNTFEMIGKHFGFTPQAAHKLVMEGLKAIVAEPAEELRTLEVERLDHMLSAIWPDVVAGDISKQAGALRIMERRARLLGIDAPERREHTGKDGGPIQTDAITDATRVAAIMALFAKANPNPST